MVVMPSFGKSKSPFPGELFASVRAITITTAGQFGRCRECSPHAHRLTVAPSLVPQALAFRKVGQRAVNAVMDRSRSVQGAFLGGSELNPIRPVGTVQHSPGAARAVRSQPCMHAK